MDEMMKEGKACGSGGCGGGSCGGSCGACKCIHHKLPSILITLFGLLFLLKAFDSVSVATVDIVWPILVVVGGLTKLSGGKCKCC